MDLMTDRTEAATVEWKELWGKTSPYKALCCHMIDAGCCAKAYLESSALIAVKEYLAAQWNCTAEEAVCFTAYLISLHDIGKATPHFQMQNEGQLERLKNAGIGKILPDYKLNPVRHEFLSQRIFRRIWKKRDPERRLSDAYSCVLSLHHQRINEAERIKQSIHERWQDIQNDLEETVHTWFPVPNVLPKAKCLDSVCMLLTGILILSDWIASSGAFDSLPQWTDNYYFKSYEIAQTALKRYGLTEDHRIQNVDSFQSMWPDISEPRDIQRKAEMLDADALLTIIEAPMGEGKTEAALYYAERTAKATNKRGLYIALPTQATSNQMYGRVNSLLREINGANARLMHGTAFLMKNQREEIRSEDASEAEKWLGSARMALLDENGVGTVDQAMGAVLMARFSVLRLLGLSNKALIIDELHAYDAYMSRIIELLLRWCRSLQIPVILLSATLQDSQRMRYISCYTEDFSSSDLNQSYPLITQINRDQTVAQMETKASRTLDYSFVPMKLGQDEKLIVSTAVEMVRQGGCCCVIVNTVNKAQKVYSALLEIRNPETEVYLFHARYLMKRRNEIEKECLQKFGKDSGTERPQKAILIATQVVEQSLDIDFDGMISELAPVDLLLQRAGRVHRHRNRIRPEGMKTPVIRVILPSDKDPEDLEKRYGASGYVYDPFLLYNTEQLLEKETKMRIPEDVRGVISQVYENVSEKNMEVWNKRVFNTQLFSANADWAAFPPPAMDYFFPTQSHPEYDDMNVDDGFDGAAGVSTRLGDPTFRIAFVDSELLKAAHSKCLTGEQQKEILLSSVSLRSTSRIDAALAASSLYQIRKGALWGCYLADDEEQIFIDGKRLVNDPILGVYWEG